MREHFRGFAKRVVLATGPGRRLQARLHALQEEVATLRQACEVARQETLAVRQKGMGATKALEQMEAALQGFGDEPPFVPNGHFYSPIARRADLIAEESRIYPTPAPEMLGIDLRIDAQLRLIEQLGELCADAPFTETPEQGRRYGFDNSAYSYGDALCLHGMLRLLRPKRLIEVGSGHSSCMTLDTRDLFLGGALACTFIEPYPQLLYSLLKPGDRESIRMIPERVQDADLAIFSELEAGDVLFIDSTHVSRVGSDVNHLYFNVLPRLAPGVYVHIHDVFHAFEYPREWVIEDGRAWNEQYLLRALLQDSKGFEVVLFNSHLAHAHRDAYVRALPLAARNAGGSIWLKRV